MKVKQLHRLFPHFPLAVTVVVNYCSSKEGADKVVQEITSKGGKAIVVQGDVSKQVDVTRLFAETKKAYGKLNILVTTPASMIYSRSTRSPKSTSTNISISTCWACC